MGFWEEKWIKSFAGTIGKLNNVYKDLEFPPHIRDILDAMNELLRGQTFKGDMQDPEVVRAAYRRREQEVREAIPAERLLVFDVAEGWEPLCAFLGVEIPNEPFPHHNLRADFWEVLGGEPD